MHSNGQLIALTTYSVLLIFWWMVTSEDECCTIRKVKLKNISFFQQCVFQVFVTAVWLLFLTRGVIVFMNVMLVYVSQHKPVTAGHYVIVTWRTVDHVDACFKEVCSTMHNPMITPCIICHDACEVGIPRWKSIIQMEELCPIRLKHKE